MTSELLSPITFTISDHDRAFTYSIENKTGIEREHAYDFVLKELLDNAVDYLETQHNTTSTTADIPPEIHVAIKKTAPLLRLNCPKSMLELLSQRKSTT